MCIPYLSMVSLLHSKVTNLETFLQDCFPKGALTEVSGPSGSGKTEVVLGFLAKHSELKVAWVEQKLSIYPSAFPLRKISLSRVLFVETEEYLWAAYQVLKSQVFQVLVLSAPVRQEIALRRLQIAAEKAQVVVVLLTESLTQQGTWPISVQLQVSRGAQAFEPEINILKFRRKTEWVRKAL